MYVMILNIKLKLAVETTKRGHQAGKQLPRLGILEIFGSA